MVRHRGGPADRAEENRVGMPIRAFQSSGIIAPWRV